jgi:signal transduction histidine kinase
MQPKRNSNLIYGLLLGVWVLVVAWQIEEHIRVREAARTDLRKRSEAIANTIGAVVRGQQFSGAVFRTRLEPVLDELVATETNGPVTGEVISIAMLNASNKVMASAGRTIDLEQTDILQGGEHWGLRSMTRVYPVEGVFLNPEGDTNSQAPLIIDQPTNSMRGGFPRRSLRPDEMGTSNVFSAGMTNVLATNAASPAGTPPPARGFGTPPGGPPGPPRAGGPGPRRPFWARGLDDRQLQEMTATHELHGLALTLSTESLQAGISDDLWLRFIIIFFAGISAAGAGFTMRNISKTAELQIRLVRASELNSHLKEMNLAAAGLAHETRNPLNIIRGLAQMLSKQTDAPTDIREKTRVIMDETDKVTAQLTEFINYSRPREVRRSKIALNSAFAEVLRTLNHDIEEKKLRVETGGEQLSIEADEQLLRQVLFNLLINAIQAVGEGGQIQIVAQRDGPGRASLEIRDDGAGVPPERRQEIFKPYFTTNQKGAGLGLAVVSQIILAHGWEIQCLANTPKGAIFRITHLKLAA